MEYVEEIRAALRALQTPLVKGLMEARDRVRERAGNGLVMDIREELNACTNAYSPLFRAAEDQVRQTYGLAPVEYYKENNLERR